MPTVRPARFEITRLTRNRGYAFLKRSGGPQRADLFRPGRRTLRLRDSHTFTSGSPNQLGGGFTEVRTVEVTLRKLR